MTWGLVEYVRHLALSALVRLVMPKTANSKASRGPATITAPKSAPSVTPTLPDLRLRALRLHNRNPQAAERYLRKHETLAKGV